MDEGLNIPFNYINPIKTVVTKLPYKIERPPQTPYIEEEEREITISFSQPLQLEDPIVEEPVITNVEQQFEIPPLEK